MLVSRLTDSLSCLETRVRVLVVAHSHMLLVMLVVVRMPIIVAPESGARLLAVIVIFLDVVFLSSGLFLLFS